MTDETTAPQDETSLEELNDEGAGAGAGEPNTFEPEEEPDVT